MFFLLRMAFWLTIVCVLLPGSGDKTSSPNIDAVQAVTLASAAVSDMRGFCDRNPNACVVGGQVATAIGHRAEAGARTIFDFVSTKLADQKSDKPAAAEDTKAVGVSATGALGTPASHGTLTASDMKPAWQAPVPLPPRREARAGRPAA